ncbi:MAG: sterol desaturase family protein [Alphaproteobacteria bacterium]|nr:sterol desaturase family protein [Alphaproteobacteria bacterium]
MELPQNVHDLAINVLAHALRPFAYPLLQNQRIFWLYLLTSFAIAAAAFAYHHRGSLKQFFAHAFPASVYRHGSARVDYLYFVVNTASFGLLFAPVIIGAPAVARFVKEMLAAFVGQPGLGLADLDICGGWGAALALTVLAVLAFDFAIFAGHRLRHFVPTLWEFHKVHHSAEVLTPVTVYRMHPVDDLLIGVLVALCTGAVRGVFDFAYAGKIAELTVFKLNLVLFLFYATGNNLRHSHLWRHLLGAHRRDRRPEPGQARARAQDARAQDRRGLAPDPARLGGGGVMRQAALGPKRTGRGPVSGRRARLAEYGLLAARRRCRRRISAC